MAFESLYEGCLYIHLPSILWPCSPVLPYSYVLLYKPFYFSSKCPQLNSSRVVWFDRAAAWHQSGWPTSLLLPLKYFRNRIGCLLKSCALTQKETSLQLKTVSHHLTISPFSSVLRLVVEKGVWVGREAVSRLWTDDAIWTSWGSSGGGWMLKGLCLCHYI